MKKIGLMDVKAALNDHRFRDTLPLEFQDDVVKYLSNPGCPCNVPIYKKIIKNCKKELKEYYPNLSVPKENEEEKEVENLSKNHFSVINCHIDELEGKLRNLPPGRKQIAICRFEDQATVVLNELDVIY